MQKWARRNEKDKTLTMKKFYTTAILVALTILNAAGQSLTIDSCYSMAKKNYPLIKQYDLIETTKDYTLSNANKAYLPQLSVKAIEGYIFGGTSSLGLGPEAPGSSNLKFIGIAQLNQTIWDGGATKTQKNIINASSEVDKASIDVALHELRTRVNQLYFGILIVDEQLAQLEVQNSILNNNASRVRQLNENGLAYSTDLKEINVEQLKLNQKKTEFRYTRNGYLSVLSLMIGVKLDDQAILIKPQVSEPLPDLTLSRPELKLYQSQRELITAQYGMQRVGAMPKIGLLGAALLVTPGLGTHATGSSSVGVAGLSASWSINSLYKNGNEKGLTQQSLNKIAIQEETFTFNINLQRSQTSANIEKQRAILAEDEEIVTLTKSIRESYETRYNTGTAAMLDVLNATAKESDARAQKAMHEIQLLMAINESKTISGNK
jgi:outer membrane protein TolC